MFLEYKKNIQKYENIAAGTEKEGRQEKAMKGGGRFWRFFCFKHSWGPPQKEFYVCRHFKPLNQNNNDVSSPLNDLITSQWLNNKV